MSTYEGEHTIFGLLGQANLTQNDVLHHSGIFTQSLKLQNFCNYYLQYHSFKYLHVSIAVFEHCNPDFVCHGIEAFMMKGVEDNLK
jgi:hypothetical protein